MKSTKWILSLLLVLALCLLTRPASYYLLRNKRQKPVGRGNVRNRNRNKR